MRVGLPPAPTAEVIMGYCITQTDSNFRIKKENRKAAFNAVKKIDTVDYHWVPQGWSKGCKSLPSVLEYWGYEAEIDKETGDIIDVSFCREKLGDEVELFKALAPYVEKGSYIEMSGEDGALWRWSFNGKTCKEIEARVEWDDDE